MAATVATLFVPGGGKVLTRDQLNQVCDLLGIPDPPKSLLPSGGACQYYLLLSASAPIPQECDATVPYFSLTRGG
jgi:hypothetical protein